MSTLNIYFQGRWFVFIFFLAPLFSACITTDSLSDCDLQTLPVSQKTFSMPHLNGRMSPVTVWSPSHASSYPRVLFFHGSRLPPERYDKLLTDLAATGLIVLAPMHIDSETIVYQTQPGLKEVWETRKADALALLNWQIGSAELPEGVSVAQQPTILAGHSFGAFTAQAMVGATAIGDQPVSHPYPVAAVIALSPPGPLPNFIGEDAWDGISTPQLITTGTADVLPGFLDDWQQHATSYNRAQPGDQWLWVGTDVDHYFGRLIGRLDREQAPQTAQYEDLLVTINAFLREYSALDKPACMGPLAAKRSAQSTLTRR